MCSVIVPVGLAWKIMTLGCNDCLQVEIMNSNPAAGRQNNSKPRQPRSVGMGVMAGSGPRGSGYPLR